MARDFYPGIGQAVAERTILRRKPGIGWESWDDVAHRVARGNSMLAPVGEKGQEYRKLYPHIANGTILMSGRHLQHGDENQPSRNMEVFVNCASSPTSFMSYYLLLNGSGVGRCYDDDMMLVNWDHSPAVRCVLDHDHPDFDPSAHESVRDARHKYGDGPGVTWFRVPDSREGWAKALELVEVAAYEKVHREELFILDFSDVRPSGRPIDGMQGRPSCGPVPTMNAFAKAATIRGGNLPRWKQAMYVDHYFAESVLVGGARRAARIAVKTWRDPSILDFIAIKCPIEYAGKTSEEIAAIRAESAPTPFLWSANNSIAVDADFWVHVRDDIGPDHLNPDRYDAAEDWNHAKTVFNVATRAAYDHGTGEPGFLNVDRIDQSDDGLDTIDEPMFSIGSKKYQPEKSARLYVRDLWCSAAVKRHFMIVNPCGEIPLAIWGAFCTIADVVPYHAATLDEAEDAFRAATRALIRVNTMDSVYSAEVKRTNRIGVGMTGIHEFAWKFFGLAFRDLIDESASLEFWRTLSRFKWAVQREAVRYSIELDLNVPHTDTTIKPAGTTSKLFGLTEGAHLPAMEFYVRWVQFKHDDPLVAEYRDKGYEVRELETYRGVVIVGFPTELELSRLGLGEKFVTAGEATPEEQYRWLMLLEKYWLRGVDEHGKPLPRDSGGQVSYTLKYDPRIVPCDEFARTVLDCQPRVKCCSVMPSEDGSSYEYLPEQPCTKAEFEARRSAIRQAVAEDVDKVHVDCASGACPVEFAK